MDTCTTGIVDKTVEASLIVLYWPVELCLARGIVPVPFVHLLIRCLHSAHWQASSSESKMSHEATSKTQEKGRAHDFARNENADCTIRGFCSCIGVFGAVKVGRNGENPKLSCTRLRFHRLYSLEITEIRFSRSCNDLSGNLLQQHTRGGVLVLHPVHSSFSSPLFCLYPHIDQSWFTTNHVTAPAFLSTRTCKCCDLSP